MDPNGDPISKEFKKQAGIEKKEKYRVRDRFDGILRLTIAYRFAVAFFALAIAFCFCFRNRFAIA
jgi:hypothetical protein